MPPEGDLSAEETVQYYFEQYSQKNQSKMESVVAPRMRGVVYDLHNLNYVNLLSCSEETEQENIDFDENWYANAYQVTMVHVEFDINYKNGYGAGFQNGVYNWEYYLAKKSEDAPWLIVMWGNG